jgi:type I restriction enzyme S subunit
LRIRAKGIVEGFWRLYTDDFYDIRLPVPPPAERHEIIAFIQSAATEIDRISQHADREIALLREYGTRLISDVVTGKLDVRNIQLPDLKIEKGLDELHEGEQIEAEETMDIEEVDDANN